jgi:SAM-dependent methyltransferase
VSKEAEKQYLEIIGEDGRRHAKGKPFSNSDCGLTLASIGTVMSLMPQAPARVLDMGCGSGWTSLFFARHGHHVVGVDLAENMVQLARELAEEEGDVSEKLQFICSDYESLDFEDEFDCVVFFDCLHHADDERAALSSAWQALKPGGVVITHEPGEGHSVAPHSVRAMELYGVNERDMPPSLIIKQARSIGFREWRIFPMQHTILDMFYGPPRRTKLFSKAGFRLARRLFELATRPSDRESAIVVLRK